MLTSTAAEKNIFFITTDCHLDGINTVCCINDG